MQDEKKKKTEVSKLKNKQNIKHIDGLNIRMKGTIKVVNLDDRLLCLNYRENRLGGKKAQQPVMGLL